MSEKMHCLMCDRPFIKHDKNTRCDKCHGKRVYQPVLAEGDIPLEVELFVRMRRDVHLKGGIDFPVDRIHPVKCLRDHSSGRRVFVLEAKTAQHYNSEKVDALVFYDEAEILNPKDNRIIASMLKPRRVLDLEA